MVIACQEQTYWLVNRPPVSPWGRFLRSRGVLPHVLTGRTSFPTPGKDMVLGVLSGDRKFSFCGSSQLRGHKAWPEPPLPTDQGPPASFSLGLRNLTEDR